VSGSDKSVADTYMPGADTDIISVWTMAPLRRRLLVNWASYISLIVTSINDNRQSSCLYRASMMIKTLHYPTNAQYIICRYN